MPNSNDIPTDAPPGYSEATASSGVRWANSTAATPGRHAGASSASGSVSHGARSSADRAAARKSMEDMVRPLPKGWVRQWDPTTQHNFFVDTAAQPPRSIWVHPLDDEQYQREHPEEARRERARYEKEHILHADTDSEEESSNVAHCAKGKASTSSQGNAPVKGMQKFGRNMKDKLTNTTHEQRVAERAARREHERKLDEQNDAIRRALMRAVQTGTPQLVGTDSKGREIYAQPPPPGYGFGCGATLGYGPYQTAGGPYAAYGPYSTPFTPYSRPYGSSFGGGGLPILGGLAGGLLLGGLLF